MVLAQVVCIPYLFWIAIAFFSYMPVELDMTIADYRNSSLSLQKATFGSAIGLGVIALTTSVFIFLNPANNPQLEFLCALKYLAAGVLALVMNQVEKRSII